MGAMLLAVAVVMADVFITLHRHCVDAGLQIRVTDLYSPAAPVTLAKLAIYLAGAFAVSLLLSHRIAGPLFRFEKSAERVGAGDLSFRVALRQADEFGAFQDKFNGMLASLKDRVSLDAAGAARVARDLDALSRTASLSASVVEDLQRLSTESAKIGTSFKLG
jgi:methyl-accepting chemotaxis protein